jgi:hypothetical protein
MLGGCCAPAQACGRDTGGRDTLLQSAIALRRIPLTVHFAEKSSNAPHEHQH